MEHWRALGHCFIASVAAILFKTHESMMTRHDMNVRAVCPIHALTAVAKKAIHSRVHLADYVFYTCSYIHVHVALCMLAYVQAMGLCMHACICVVKVCVHACVNVLVCVCVGGGWCDLDDLA